MVKFKNKLMSVIAFALVVIMMISTSVPAFAAGTASVGSVAEDVNGGTIVGQDIDQGKQTEYDEFDVTGNMTSNADVYVTVPESDIMVTVPKVVILDGKSGASNVGTYTVKVQGDIAAETVIKVVPQDEMDDRDGVNFEMSSAGKDNIPTDVEQAKTEFTYADGVRANAAASTTGTVTAYGMTAGQWNGDFVFNISAAQKTVVSEEIAYFDLYNLADNGNMETGYCKSNKNAGTPTLTSDASNTLSRSLQCFGSKTNMATGFKGLPLGDYYIACKVRVDRYVSGSAGVAVNGGGNSSNLVAVVSEETNGEFVTASGIASVSNTSQTFLLQGSLGDADLDCYVDDIVFIPLSVFETEPTKEQLDSWYEEYLNTLEATYAEETVTTENSVNTFIEAMNAKAQELGMTNTLISTPSGEALVQENYSTPRDAMKMMLEASENEVLTEIWQNTYSNDDADGTRLLTVQNSVATRDITAIATIDDETLLTNYKLLGGKTGTWGTTCIGVIVEIDGQKVIAVIMGASDDENRYTAINDLLGIASNKLADSNYDVSTEAVEAAPGAIACVVTDDGYEVLYEQNADTRYALASMTKVLNVLTALDYVDDYKNETIMAKYSDGVESLNIGDKLTYEEAFYYMMLPSSNQTARIVAREVGEMMLK